MAREMEKQEKEMEMEKPRLIICCPENVGSIIRWFKLDPLEQEEPEREEVEEEELEEEEVEEEEDPTETMSRTPKFLGNLEPKMFLSKFSCLSLGRSKIAVVGGEKSKCQFLNTVFLKDFGDNNPWVQLPPMILGRCEPLVFGYEEKIYAIGGTAYNSSGVIPHPFGEFFDTASPSKKWVPLKKLPDNIIPRDMERVNYLPPLSSAIVQGNIILFTLGTKSISLDLVNEGWNPAPAIHKKLWENRGPSLAMDGILYVCNLRFLMAYNLVEGIWSPYEVLDFGPGLVASSIFSINQHLCIFCCYVTYPSDSSAAVFKVCCLRFEVKPKHDPAKGEFKVELLNMCTSPIYLLDRFPSHCVLLNGTPNNDDIESAVCLNVHIGSQLPGSN